MLKAKELLDHGANVKAAAPARRFGAYAVTYIQAAAPQGNLELAALLVTHGADADAPACKGGGRTALKCAAEEGYVDVARLLLLDAGAMSLVADLHD